MFFKRGSKFILMFIEIEFVVYFIGSKGCNCLLGGEVYFVNFYRALVLAIILLLFVSSYDRFYLVLIFFGFCCYNFIGFMVVVEFFCVIV